MRWAWEARPLALQADPAWLLLPIGANLSLHNGVSVSLNLSPRCFPCSAPVLPLETVVAGKIKLVLVYYTLILQNSRVEPP